MSKKIISFFDFLEEKRKKTSPPILDFYKNPKDYAEVLSLVPVDAFDRSSKREYLARKVPTPAIFTPYLSILKELDIQVLSAYEYVHSDWKGRVGLRNVLLAETGKKKTAVIAPMNGVTIELQIGNTFSYISKKTIHLVSSSKTAFLRLKKNTQN